MNRLHSFSWRVRVAEGAVEDTVALLMYVGTRLVVELAMMMGLAEEE